MHSFIHLAIQNTLNASRLDPFIRRCKHNGIEIINTIPDLATLDAIVDRSEIWDVCPDGAAVLIEMRSPADCVVGSSLPDAAGGITHTYAFTLRLIHEKKWNQLLIDEVTVG